jgi:toxin HigB-1
VKLNFRTKKLQKQCNDFKKCVKKFGKPCAEKIRARLDDLIDSPNLETMKFFPQARFHALTGDRNGQFALDVLHPKRLIIKPDHDPVPTLEDGSIDLKKVTQVTVVEITDYH